MAEKCLQIKERQICQRTQESTNMDDIVRDTVIVSQIKAKCAFKEIEEGLIHDGNLEKEQIATEYEAIIRKQLQMLQADERGRQALQNEIAEIRKKQEKRAEALRNRAKALEIEKERAKRVANRPPPLPRSVRLLLKEQAKKDRELVAEDLNSNLSPSDEVFEDDIEDSEDKENIDEEYLAEKRKMQEEWDRKAKKRFNEALKKDRQKQEHDAILKDIENAEKFNRRQMARNISEPTGKVPNYLPDKLHHSEKQVAMEDAVENVFKKKNPKEHAVEDLEGYQDKWEAKYKQIDSVLESRMIDCVPSFVKENYSYLLQEESTLPCGKRFSGLDDSTDDLNTAYIESPPADILNNSKEIDAVISQLDQMRVELNEAYEKEFKPLLEAAATPKILSLDKSVETDILKLPTEDKAIEVARTPPKKQAPLSSRSVQVDILQGGVMSYQRRGPGNMYRSLTNNSGRYLPTSFEYQSDTTSEVRSPRSALETWSSSSYWSLPSKHGLPDVCKICDSPGCKIPLVEDEKLHRDCVPLGKNLSKQSVDMAAESLAATNDIVDDLVKDKERHSPRDELHSNLIKSKLSSYIRLVADKYLKKSTTSPKSSGSPEEVLRANDQTSSKADLIGSTAISKSKFSQYVEVSDQRTADIDPVQTSSASSGHFFRKQSVIGEETSAHASEETGQYEYEQLGLNKLKSSEYDLLSNINSSGENDELLKNCHDVIATNLLDVFSPDRVETVSADVSHSSDQSVSPNATEDQHYKKESLTGYMYHDLSTIPEMDSVLTNDTKESSLNETQGSAGKKSLPQKADIESISPDEIDTTSASLVDTPVSEVSEIAKSIRFIRKPTPEPVEMDVATEELIPLISGTLSDFQTPPSAQSNIRTPMRQTPTLEPIQMAGAHEPLRLGTLSSFSSITDARTSDLESRSYDLRTPSPLSTLNSISATKSQGRPYSSSLRDSKTTHSPLTSSSVLSKYFQDISSIRHVSETSSKSSRAASTPVQIDVGRETELYESSSGTFLPMTPHTHLSTPSEYSEKQKDHNVMKRSHLVSKHPSVSAKPFSPRKNQHASHIGNSFQKNISDSNPDSFKPLSLLMSDVSTPKDTILKHKNIISSDKDVQCLDKPMERYQYESTADSNDFQQMTPHSYFSSPGDIPAPCSNKLEESTTGKELKKGSVNIRLRIPVPFNAKTASPTYEEQGTSAGPKSFTYPIRLMLDVKDFANSSKDIENYIEDDSHEQQTLPKDSSIQGDPYKKQILSSQTTENYTHSENAVKHVTKDLKSVKVPSSGFVPHFSPEDFTPFEKKEIDKNEKDLFAAGMSESTKNVADSKADISSKYPNSLLHSKNNAVAFSNYKNSLKNSASVINNDLKNMANFTSSVEHGRGCTSSSHGEARAPSTSPNPILQALAQQLASSSSKSCTPCVTPSNASSTENLSEMFTESKITYQSTPAKSIEELIQETGILEEPSLTLMNTEITIKPDSPEKYRLLSEGSLLSEDFKTPLSLQSACFTPGTLDTPSDSASSPYCDSPSMISFLKHEQSCLTSGNTREKPLSVVKTSQNEYKKRTKRLWNNLEEVRTKKLMEEKQEQIRKNRLKMKSYSKKAVTPKKK